MELKGYTGRVLRFDLTVSKVTVEDLEEEWAQQFIGGSGLGAKFLYEMTDETTDSSGLENPLIFMTGPFTGTSVPLSGRHARYHDPRSPVSSENRMGKETFEVDLPKFAGECSR
jgi:aldehyde:ferredoxin oxidoreductase